MKIYNVGSDEPYDLPTEDNEHFEWMVYWYENGGYDGSGEAVALGKDDGLLYIKNLGHCSCYGPMDGGMESGVKVSVEKILEDKDNIHDYDARKEIKDKVLELLSIGNRPIFTEKFSLLG